MLCRLCRLCLYGLCEVRPCVCSHRRYVHTRLQPPNSPRAMILKAWFDGIAARTATRIARRFAGRRFLLLFKRGYCRKKNCGAPPEFIRRGGGLPSLLPPMMPVLLPPPMSLMSLG